MQFASDVKSFCFVFFPLSPSYGGVLLTAPQMKFIGIPTSLSLSQPLHHILFDKWCRSPEQIILFLSGMSYVSFPCICIEARVDGSSY